MQKLIINLPDQIGVVFKLRDGTVTCNSPDLEAHFRLLGVEGLDGCRYFPEDGTKFLEAVFDHYFLMGADVEFLDRKLRQTRV